MYIYNWLNGISTLGGYSMPNLVYTWFLSGWFVGNILNKPELICLRTVKWLQVFYLTLIVLFADS